MSFKRESGDFNLVHVTNAISTLYSKGALVYPNPDTPGSFIPADSTSGNHLGITEEESTATEDRYTTAGEIAVDILIPGDLVRATAAGLTAAKEGTFMDLTNSTTVNGAATSKNVVFLVKYISATEGIFMVNALASVANVTTS